MGSERKPARGNDYTEPDFQTSRPRTSKAVAEPRPSYTLNGKSHATLEPGTYQAQELIDAGILEIGDGYRAKNSELGNEGMPFARAANINDGFHFQQADRFPSANIARVGTKLSQPGDVVFTSKGTVGRFAFVTEDIEPFVYSPQLCYWRSADDQTLLPGFLYFWMQSGQFLNQIGYLKGQTDMADYVSLRDQRKMTVTFPPVSQQLEIAATLGTLEARISLLRQTSATLEAIAQALFKSWFVDFDPVQAKAEGREPDGMDAATAALFPDSFEDSPLGPIPRGWHASSLSDCMELNPQRVLRKGTLASYLDMANAPTQGHRPAEVTQRELGSGSKFINGDTLLAKITPCLENGKTAFVDFLADNEVGWGSTEFIVMRPKAPLPPFWGYLLARTPNFRAFAIQAMTGTSGRQRVDLGSLKQFSLVVPDDGGAEAFGKIIEPLRARIAAASSHADNLTQLRDTLLPRLISGKLRLPEVSGLIEEAIA